MMYINNISINVKQSNRSRVRRAPGQVYSAAHNRTGAGTTRVVQQNNLIGRRYEVQRAVYNRTTAGTTRAMGETPKPLR